MHKTCKRAACAFPFVAEKGSTLAAHAVSGRFPEKTWEGGRGGGGGLPMVTNTRDSGVYLFREIGGSSDGERATLVPPTSKGVGRGGDRK